MAQKMISSARDSAKKDRLERNLEKLHHNGRMWKSVLREKQILRTQSDKSDVIVERRCLRLRRLKFVQACNINV